MLIGAVTSNEWKYGFVCNSDGVNSFQYPTEAPDKILSWAFLLVPTSIIFRDGDREPVQTRLSIAVNQSKTGPPSKRFGFLCMHRVPGGIIKLSAPTSSLASQCLPSAMIKQPFQNLSSLVPCPTFTMLRSLLSVEKVPRELVYRELLRTFQFRIQEMSLINRLGNRDKTEP